MKSVLIAALLLLGAVAKTPEPQTLALDRERLERNEDLSESLANQLLAMSVAVRRQDLTEVASSFPATDPLEATPFPDQPGIEKRKAWQRHEKYEGRRCEHPCRVAGIEPVRQCRSRE